MARWVVERIVQFESPDFLKNGLAHFGFHLRDGRYIAIAHARHYVASVALEGHLEWTLAVEPVLDGVPNISAELEFPMYADLLHDGTLAVSNFRSARLYSVDTHAMHASLLVDGHELGMTDMGNCVVDDEGLIWVNEVTGCRLWRFDRAGRAVETLGDGTAGFQRETMGFDRVRFSWIYDIRRGPNGTIYVLDSKNFALREVDPRTRTVSLVSGSGKPGYTGDGESADKATFGSDPTAAFDGPISLSLDEDGNAYVGDRFNGVVRMIEHDGGTVSTIAGRTDRTNDEANDPTQRDPLRLNLPMISSLDYADSRLFVPTDLDGDRGDLAVLRRLTG